MTTKFTEKEFFLNAFHATTLAFVLHEGSDLAQESLDALRKLVMDLCARGGRVVLFVQQTAGVTNSLANVLRNIAPRAKWIDVGRKEVDSTLLKLCGKSPVKVMAIQAETVTGFLDQVCAIAKRVRFVRMIFVDKAGGLLNGGNKPVGYMKPDRLALLLQHGEEGFASPRLALLTTVGQVLHAGVGAVSLCRLEEAANELFTYEGAGTFFSASDYCQVRPLRLDEFAEAAAILRRGVREGYLLRRNRIQRLEVLTVGFGAFIADGHLAGVCGLLTAPYQNERVGEVVSLYTLTRFLGEGVGSELLRGMERAGRAQGLKQLFSCTRQPAVADFYMTRLNYRRASHDEVPAAKWHHYDPSRKEQVVCLIKDLE